MSEDDAECIARWLSAAESGRLDAGAECIVAEVRRLRAESERLQKRLDLIREMSGSVTHDREEDCVGCGCMQLTAEEAVAYATLDAHKVKGELAKLRGAIRNAGFAVMQTSGAWSIHDVSEKAKQHEADDLVRVNRLVDLEIENERLRSESERLRAVLKPVAAFLSLPNWENRCGPWRAENDALRAIATAHAELLAATEPPKTVPGGG